MISVICTQCRAQLEMDDAFAGGVCRCQYCGTIQTVPSLAKLKRQSAPTAAAPAMAPAPYTPTPPRPQTSAGQPAPAGDGLDALAEAVATSSGLGRGSLRAGAALGGSAAPAGAVSAAAPQAPPAVPLRPVDYARPPQQPRRGPVLLIAGALGGALLLVVLGWVLFSVRSVATGPGPTPTPPRTGPGASGGGTTNNVAPPAPDEPIEEVAIPTHPHFCGINLQGEPSVVYLLDRGAATAEMFDTLKEATYRSLESLKPSQKFAVIFWPNGGEDACYPEGSLADVRPTEIQAAKQRFADVYPGSRADPHEAIRMAAALKPAAIVLVTGKAFDLEDELVDHARELLGGNRTKVHTVALGSDDGNTVLQRISKATGGESRIVTKPQLRAYAD